MYVYLCLGDSEFVEDNKWKNRNTQKVVHGTTGDQVLKITMN